MKHHTKDKGDLGLSYAIFDLTKKGFQVYLPLSEHQSFDLIAYKDLKCYRIQVKYREMKNGILKINFKTSWADKNGTHEKPVDKKEIDYYCIYCPDTEKCYYFDPKDFGQGIALRITPPKSLSTNQYGYKFAENYTELPRRDSNPDASPITVL